MVAKGRISQCLADIAKYKVSAIFQIPTNHLAWYATEPDKFEIIKTSSYAN